MLICRSASLETWKPDFSSSEQHDPTWTRVLHGDSEITNALNWIDWDGIPVQVIICEACGYTCCAEGGYVHVTRLGNWVLWTSPQPDEDHPASAVEEVASPTVRRHGGVAIPRDEWHRWRGGVPALPSLTDLHAATGTALADAWRMSVVGPGRASSLAEMLPTLRRNLLSSDTLGVDGAIRAVEGAVARLEQMAGQAIEGSLVRPESIGATVETLYFDGPQVTEWPALALSGDDALLVLAPDCVFVPEEPAT